MEEEGEEGEDHHHRRKLAQARQRDPDTRQSINQISYQLIKRCTDMYSLYMYNILCSLSPWSIPKSKLNTKSSVPVHESININI